MTKNNQGLSICFLSHSSGNAGAEKALAKLLKGLQLKDTSVKVILPSYGPLVDVLEKSSICYEIVPYKRWLNESAGIVKKKLRTIFNILMVFPVIMKIFKWKPDIIYTNTSTICTGAFAAKITGTPHVWHFREFGFEDYGYEYDMGAKLSRWLTNKLSTICLVNSKAVANKYKEFIPENKLRVIYEAYEETESRILTEDIKPIKKGIMNCIMVGTLHPAKGIKDAINAISKLHEAGVKPKLFIAGIGNTDYEMELKSQVDSLDLNDYVEFCGYLNSPQLLIRQCDVLLMCSRNEAFGLVTLEAMQNGKPVIGSRIGGTMEIIQDGYNGLLYNPGDVTDLTDKIMLLYKNPELARKMGENALKWTAEKFSPERYINETLMVEITLIELCQKSESS
jgi:glycosyltransferase involved in cell wall biosynthesis